MKEGLECAVCATAERGPFWKVRTDKPSRWRLEVDLFGWNMSSIFIFISLFMSSAGLVEHLQYDLVYIGNQDLIPAPQGV